MAVHVECPRRHGKIWMVLIILFGAENLLEIVDNALGFTHPSGKKVTKGSIEHVVDFKTQRKLSSRQVLTLIRVQNDAKLLQIALRQQQVSARANLFKNPKI